MSQFVFRELEAGQDFNPLALNPTTPFTQAPFYGEWQEALGRKVRRLLVYQDNKVVAYLQLIKYPLIRGWYYLYAPYGPVLKNFRPELLAAIAQHLRDLCEQEKAAFARLDFTPPPEAQDYSILLKFFQPAAPYTYHSAYFQPRAEWFLDLGRPINEMFLQLDKKTRYSIRQAEKAGVTTEIIGRDFGRYFADFYHLMEETAERQSFQLHPHDYYQHIFQQMKANNGAFLVVAKYHGQILVVNLIIIFGDTANYIFSGASNNQRELSASYLAQWRSITESARRGARCYNFGGIARDGEMSHGWQGLTLFKKKFGGYPVEHSPFYDLVARPWWYRLYNLRKWLLSLKIV